MCFVCWVAGRVGAWRGRADRVLGVVRCKSVWVFGWRVVFVPVCFTVIKLKS